MKRFFHQLLSSAFLIVVVSSCNTKESLPTPTIQPKSASAASTTVTQYVYYSTPEPMIYATAVSDEMGLPQIWAIGSSQVTGGHPMYKRSESTQTFSQVKGPNGTGISGPNIGGVVKIALYQAGTSQGSQNPTALYAVTDQNKLWVSSDGGSNWIDTGLMASDVAAGKKIGTYPSPAIYFLGVESIYGGHRIYQLIINSQGQYQGVEFAPGAAAVSIAVTNTGSLVVVSSVHEIFVENSTADGFDQISGGAINIVAGNAIAITGTKYLSYGYEIYTRDKAITPTSNWELQGGNATQLGRSYANYFLVVSSLGEVYRADYTFN